MSDRRLAFATLVGGMIAFGGTWPAGKVAAEHVPPAVVAVLRFSSAALLLWLWSRLSGAPVRRPERRDVPLVLLLGFSVVFAYNLFFLYGVRHAPAADGSVLVPGLIPLATMLLAWPLLGERPTRRAVGGLVVALVGIVIVADPAGGIDSSRLVGDGLFLAAAFAWAVYTLAGRRAIARYGSVSANVYATAVGTVLLVPVTFLGGGWGPLARAPVQAWGAIAYLSLAGTVIGFVAFYEGVRLVGSASASSFALLVPIFGVLSSVLVLGESLHASLVVGGVLVVAGLWLGESRRLDSARAPDRAAVPAPVGDGRAERHS
jgi:drug/metabolite transporter (DMT)-like permease